MALDFKKIIFSIFIVLFVSCESETEFDEFSANLDLWKSFQLENYSIAQNTQCYCGGLLAYDLTVINGVKKTVSYDESQLAPGFTYQDVLDAARTVEETFDFIKSVQSKNPASLYVEYHKTYGFPTLISIDYIKEAIDDEVAYIYSDFNLLYFD